MVRLMRLYGQLLRTHRRVLPTDMRVIGDEYVKKEFRLHRDAKAELKEVFFVEWEAYLAQLSEQQAPRHMRADVELSKEQKTKLQELKESIHTNKAGQ